MSIRSRKAIYLIELHGEFETRTLEGHSALLRPPTVHSSFIMSTLGSLPQDCPELVDDQLARDAYQDVLLAESESMSNIQRAHARVLGFALLAPPHAETRAFIAERLSTFRGSPAKARRKCYDLGRMLLLNSITLCKCDYDSRFVGIRYMMPY